MSHGIRGQPWLFWKQRDQPGTVSHLLDCGSCKKTYALQSRQLMGCGWEPAIAGARPWWPSDLSGEPDVCIGYARRLPEVVEVSRAFTHWKHGTVREFFDNAPITGPLLQGLEELSASVNELEGFIARPRK